MRQPHEPPRLRRRSVLTLLGAAPLAAGGALAASRTTRAAAEPSPSSGALRTYDRYLADLAAQDRFSGAALVAHRGRPVLAKAYGMADRDQSVPNTVDTRFNLASASAPFTALAIVRLEQQGKLAFHETLGTYLDGFPAELADQVTVHQLLTHTSGMGPRPAGPNHVTDSVSEEWAYVTTGLRGTALEFTPGTRYAYSSSGMDTLGEIVATVSGTSFWDYVKQNVFAPAGMRSAAYHTRSQWLSDRRIAHPFPRQADGTRVDGVRHLDAVDAAGANPARRFVGSGAGGAFCTVGDLLRFAVALRANKLLGPAYTELYTGPKFPVPPNDPEPDPSRAAFVGYGVEAGIVGYHRRIGHGATTAGITTNWSVYLDTDWMSAVLCNYDYDPARFQDILAHERAAVLATMGRQR